MTKVRINPGICGFVTQVTAQSDDQEEVTVKVASGCESVRNMMEALGDTFDAYEVCLTKPGANMFFQYAAEHFPVHAGCPVICGIVKCVEAECRLALKQEASIVFVDE